MDRNKYILYTDGCCLKNRVGGIGVYLQLPIESENEDIRNCKGFNNPTTNNRMELRAGIEGLKLLREKRKEFGYKDMAWCTDSKYVSKNVYNFSSWRKNNVWERSNGEPVSNKDLWKELEAVRSSLRIYPTWIPEKENREADRLSKLGARTPLYKDFGYNPGRVGTSMGNNKEAPTFYKKTESKLCIKIYEGDGEKAKNKCKIRFQIISNDKVSVEKYYAYTSLGIYNKLHRTYKYIISINDGFIESIIKEL